ncbi:Chitinase A [Andreprevotia sp. IGB-42]|uniref:glycosyl hydrolase family 18 protein n=1 Tax=Andreprevotia sp. IGB-42 TaxID=2497473 RepID=UPI001359EAF0|nr:glycosyl hydrolase family 18 protein [Andreprevotia sp. IGB-42]KAF0813678.1 Chitinase A [Andreprevotia sp. IGB-42]
MRKALIAAALLAGASSVHADDSYNYFAGKPQPFKQTSGKVVTAYYYGEETVDQLAGNNLTHLVYSFLRVCGPGEFSGDKAVCDANRARLGAAGSDHRLAVNENTPDAAAHARMVDIKKRFPHLKITAAIGGWGGGNAFYYFANDATKRALFVQSVVDYLRNHTALDGIDIDWESPTDNMWQDGVQLGSPEDRQGYIDLMRDLRAALTSLGQQNGRTYLLTTALGANAVGGYLNLPVDQVHPFVDYVYVMSYDYAGAWSSDVGHHTNIKCTSYASFCLEKAMQSYLSAVPAEKVVLGVAMYARGWTNVANMTNPANPMTGKGEVQGFGGQDMGPGEFLYKQLYGTQIGSNGQGLNGYEVRYDANIGSHYLWNESNKRFIGYDDPRDVEQKGKLAVANKLGGVMAWALSQDNGDILNAMNLGVGNQRDQLLPECPSQLWNKKQVYHGGDTVAFNQQIVQARWWTLGERPKNQEWDVWRNLGNCY